MEHLALGLEQAGSESVLGMRSQSRYISLQPCLGLTVETARGNTLSLGNSPSVVAQLPVFLGDALALAHHHGLLCTWEGILCLQEVQCRKL